MEPGSPALGAWTPGEALTIPSLAVHKSRNQHSFLVPCVSQLTLGLENLLTEVFRLRSLFLLEHMLMCATWGLKVSLCIRVALRMRKSQSHHLA